MVPMSKNAKNEILSSRETLLLSYLVTERIGRELAKLYKEETGRRIPYATIYLILDRLKERGLVRCRESEVNGRRVRFFKLAGSGAVALEQARRYYESVSRKAAEAVVLWGTT